MLLRIRGAGRSRDDRPPVPAHEVVDRQLLHALEHVLLGLRREPRLCALVHAVTEPEGPLAEARRADLVDGAALPPREVAALSAWIERYREIWEADFERLDMLLEELQRRPTNRLSRKKRRRTT